MRDALRRFAACVALLLSVIGNTLAAQRISLDAAARRTWADLLGVHDARSADTLVIDQALASPVVPLRAAAARVVGMNRISARYAVLRERLSTERDSSAARDAAFALGLAQDGASCDALAKALAAPATGAAAAWALGELGATCGEFGALLAKAGAGPARAALLRVAVKWTPFPDSVVVRAFRAATATDAKWAALYALARGRRAAGAALAVEASRSADPGLREVAARLMTAVLQPAPDSLRVVARLDSLLRDRAPHVRIAAVRSLATYRALARVPLAQAWERERDANVRITMAQSIGTVAVDTSAVWRRWWSSDTTHMVRRSLLTSAWQANAVSALTGVDTALDTAADFRMRIAMIEGAASAGPDRVLPRLVLRLDDRDGRVRAAALSALAAASPRARDSIGWNARLATALQDTDVGVRAAALVARLRTDISGAAGDAIDAYERARLDTISDAREAALDLLTAAWRSDSVSVTAEQLTRLQSWAVPSDPLLIQRARQITPLRHWQGGATPRASTAEYERVVREVIAPALDGRAPALMIETDRGVVRIVLDGVWAPMTSDHLMRLARAGYFRNLRFHRVVPAFVAQGGDPRGDGSGGPGYAIRDELNRASYVRGAVGMALSGPDTGGSQFFLTLAPQPHLDGHYTVFGRVAGGLAAMDALVQGDRMRTITPVPR